MKGSTIVLGDWLKRKERQGEHLSSAHEDGEMESVFRREGVSKPTCGVTIYKKKQKILLFLEKLSLGLCVFFSLLALLCGKGIDLVLLCGVLLSLALLLVALTRHKYRWFPLVLFVGSALVYIALAGFAQNPAVSDFLIQFESAQSFVAGDQGAYASAYYESYPWQIGWSLVEAFLLAMGGGMGSVKTLQCVCSAGILVLVYLFVYELHNRKTAQCVSVVLAIFPSFFIMTGVLTNQVLSAFLYMLGLYFLFSKFAVNAIPKMWLRCVMAAILFAFGNFIRPDGVIVVVACAATILVCSSSLSQGKTHFSKNIKGAASLVLTYGLVGLCLSSSIVFMGINPMGAAQADTTWKFAIGSNNESNGTWSESAVARVEEKIAEGLTRDEANISVMRENLASPETNIETVLKKNWALWWGDSLYFGLIQELDEQPFLAQWLHLVDKCIVFVCFLACLFSFAANFVSKKRNKLLMCFSLIFLLTCGAYQIIEVQSRYVYFCYIIMFMIAADGLCIAAKALQRIINRGRDLGMAGHGNGSSGELSKEEAICHARFS